MLYTRNAKSPWTCSHGYCRGHLFWVGKILKRGGCGEGPRRAQRKTPKRDGHGARSNTSEAKREPRQGRRGFAGSCDQRIRLVDRDGTSTFAWTRTMIHDHDGGPPNSICPPVPASEIPRFAGRKSEQTSCPLCHWPKRSSPDAIWKSRSSCYRAIPQSCDTSHGWT